MGTGGLGAAYREAVDRGGLDCRSCRLFLDRPDEIEGALPGLTILSSASGSTRGHAGICLARQTFQDPEPACPEFKPRAP